MALRIKPSRGLIDFLSTLPEKTDFPPNVEELRKCEENVTITNSDLRWIGNYIRKVNLSQRLSNKCKMLKN